MRDLEINFIAYKLPSKSDDHFLHFKMANGDYAVETPDGILLYSRNEIIEIYEVDPEDKVMFERLGWTA